MARGVNGGRCYSCVWMQVIVAVVASCFLAQWWSSDRVRNESAGRLAVTVVAGARTMERNGDAFFSDDVAAAPI